MGGDPGDNQVAEDVGSDRGMPVPGMLTQLINASDLDSEITIVNLRLRCTQNSTSPFWSWQLQPR